jgi:hypothetical protein
MRDAQLTGASVFWARHQREAFKSMRILVASVVLFFAAVPLSFIAYVCLGGALGGLAIVVALGIVQWPLYVVVKRVQHSNAAHTRDRSA